METGAAYFNGQTRKHGVEGGGGNCARKASNCIGITGNTGVTYQNEEHFFKKPYWRNSPLLAGIGMGMKTSKGRSRI